MKTIKAELHLVATERRGIIAVDSQTEEVVYVFDDSYCQNEDYIHHHLYFTSDEEIKEGDWVYSLSEGIIRITERELNYRKYIYKIVASTDPKLSNSCDCETKCVLCTGEEQLPQPSKQLVEAYCKAPFNECLIEREAIWYNHSGDVMHVKQASITEIEREEWKIKVNDYNEITCHPVTKTIREIVESHIKDEYWCKDETEHECFEDGTNTTVDIDAMVAELETLIK